MRLCRVLSATVFLPMEAGGGGRPAPISHVLVHRCGLMRLRQSGEQLLDVPDRLWLQQDIAANVAHFGWHMVDDDDAALMTQS